MNSLESYVKECEIYFAGERGALKKCHDPTCFGQIILGATWRLHWKGDILEKDILENRINPIQEHSERLL